MKGRFKNALINWLALVSNLTRGLFLLVSLGIHPALAATDCKQVTQISPPECETLVALYKSTDGPNWNDSQTNNWNITNEPCQWAGITCENAHVTQINREYANLVGTLPDLSALTALQSLDLGTNCGLRCGYWQNSQLTGTLPNLSALTNLTFLDLSGNKFSGTINISSLLFKCPAGGSFGIKPDPNKFDFGTAVVNDPTTITLNTRSQDCGDFKVKGIEFVGTSKDEFAFTGDPQQDCYEGEWNGHHYSSCQFILTFTPQSGGQAGADEVQEATTCNGDYWNIIGTDNCAQPGASLILSVGHDPESLFRNEGIIKAGNGGEGKLHHGYGGNINIYGATIIDSLTETNCGMIKSGDGGSISNETENVINKLNNIPQRCLDVLNELTHVSNQYGSVTNESTNVTQIIPGRSGKGGDLTLIADYSLYTQGEVIVAAGDGGNCNAEQTQGGNGGHFRFNASKRIDLSGGYFGAGKGSINCQTNGVPGNISSDPSVISLSGASTRINGGNITLFGGDDWVLDLSNLSQAAIKATGDITLAVGKDSIIDLRGNKVSILEAGGQVNLFADDILLDTGANLHQIIKAENIVVGPSKILYDVALLGAGKYSGEPGTTLSVPLTVVNNGPKADTYTLKVDNQKGWALSEIPSTVAVKELGIHELSFTVTLPNERGASNLITLTATSQGDPSVTAVANVLVTVDQEIVTLPEMTPIPVTVTCDTQLPLLESAPQTTQYRLAGGAAVNGGLFEPQVTVKLTDKVEVRGVLCAAEEVVGRNAEVVVYADYQPIDSVQVQSHYMLDNKREVQSWDRKDEHLFALGSIVIALKQEVGLYRGVFPVIGKVSLYFGYRLTDGTVVSNAKGIVVNVEP